MPDSTNANPSGPRMRDIRRPGMAGWHDLGQLFRTGIEVVSTLFGKRSDSRRLDAFSTAEPIVDYRDAAYADADGTFGFDYIANTGDGRESTYSMAYAVSLPEIVTSDEKTLPRGRLLILGGDLVSPYPAEELYEDRLVAPFRTAGQLHQEKRLEILAIPGHHDWYDSLVNFRRLFCRGRDFAFRRTQQSRSYFAARLPGNWCLFGIDARLDGDIDQPQYDFFDGVLKTLDDGERVILCLPEPVWHQRWERPPGPAEPPALLETPTLLEILENRIGDRLRLAVAGGLHHYQRHTSAEGRHLVTCGTGGAFLHPTHRTPADPTGQFEHTQSFPDRETSKELTDRNQRFPARNPFLGVYRLVSSNGFGMHRNEAFSALRSQDWKGFLRFKIDQDGNLVMRFVGFRTVPGRWVEKTLRGNRRILEPAPADSLTGDIVDEVTIPATCLGAGSNAGDDFWRDAKVVVMPGARKAVAIRLDEDVLDFIQGDGA